MQLFSRSGWSAALAVCALLGATQGACVDQSGPGGSDSSDVIDDTSTDATPDTTPDTVIPGEGLAFTRLDPDRGSTAGLEEVQLYGRGFAHAVAVRFGEVPAAEFFAVSDDLIVALTPPRTAGLVDVSVFDDQENVATIELAFTFRDDVQVTLVEPASGNVRGGEVVTISGAGFTSDAMVIIGGHAAPVVDVASDGSLTAITPAGVAGPADLYVTTRFGVGRYQPGFTYDDAPRIDVVAPSTGPIAGGTPIVITGAGFKAPVAVRFGTAPLQNASVDSVGRITGIAPARAVPGPVDVTVTSPVGTAIASRAFHYLDGSPATFDLRAAYPSQGSVAGGDHVTLVVTGLSTTAAEVRFGGRLATIVSQDPAAGVVVAQSPAADAAQTVPVSIRQDGTLRELTAAFTYVEGPIVSAIEPSEGPVEGGTKVTIRGSGFKPGVVVRIGALAATGVRLIDNRTLEATTAAGSPGPAGVSVTVSGVENTLPGAYTYRGRPALWLVTPPSGAVAGGTRVHIYGHGFDVGGPMQVVFGTSNATEVVVVNDGLITARTPRGPAGVVPVTVRTASWDAKHPNGFIYFDPAAQPGTWGEPIDGGLNVTVLDARSGLRVAGAAVVVGSTVNTVLRGFANDAGQITFSTDALVGEQTVTASRTGYQTMQIAGFDAENVTLAIEPVPTCAEVADIPCEQLVGPTPIAFFSGHVLGSTKGPTIPWGECNDWGDAAGSLCRPCSADSECDEGKRCGELPGQGFFCTADCAVDTDCGRDFRCVDTSGAGGPGQCVPPPGETKVYCDITETDMQSSDQIPYPGVEVGSDNSVFINTRLGDYAVYCWRGVLARNFFRPQVMGITRHLGAYADGEQVEADITLDIPLRRDVAVVVDKPVMGPPNGESIIMRTLLNLQGDGVAEMPPLRSISETRFHEVLPELTGTISDAVWDFFVSVDVPSLNGNSSTIEPGIIDVQNDLDLALGPDGWERRKTFETVTRGIAPIEDDLLVVGDAGRIARSFGPNHWAFQDAGTKRDLFAVAVRSQDLAVAVGAAGVATFWDGFLWHAEEVGTQATLAGVTFAGDDMVFAVGGRYVFQWEAGKWTEVFTAPAVLHGVWASGPSDVWLVGDAGYIGHFDGSAWTREAVTTIADLHAVGPGIGGAPMVVGRYGTVLTWDGSAFILEEAPTSRDLLAVASDANGGVYVAGRHGKLLSFDGLTWKDESLEDHKAALLAVGAVGDKAFAMGSHEIVLGPMLAIPDQLNPGDGGFLNDRMSWTVDEEVSPHFQVLDFGSAAGPCFACGAAFMIPYSEWLEILDGDLTTAYFPAMQQMEPGAGLSFGVKDVAIYRVRVATQFDFDDTASNGFFNADWRSWAVRGVTFFR